MFVFSCKTEVNNKTENSIKSTYQEIVNDDYVLNNPIEKTKATLILFGGYPEKAEDIEREFKILESTSKNDVSVLYMNYNRKLWMEQNELLELSEKLKSIFTENRLSTNNIYIGGFSSGGNIALLISDFIINRNCEIIPKGVFIGDSPLDLAELYKISEKNVQRNLSKGFEEESKWLIETLGEKMGNPNRNISNYERYSVFTLKTKNINNLKHLRQTKIRLYTEPDTLWWKEQTMAKYEDMNAYYIKQLFELLNTSGFKHVEYIPTENKGYRSNGDRNPHSWSIIDKQGLIDWMLEK
jgi:hypothetical protein